MNYNEENVRFGQGIEDDNRQRQDQFAAVSWTPSIAELSALRLLR